MGRRGGDLLAPGTYPCCCAATTDAAADDDDDDATTAANATSAATPTTANTASTATTATSAASAAADHTSKHNLIVGSPTAAMRTRIEANLLSAVQRHKRKAFCGS